MSAAVGALAVPGSTSPAVPGLAPQGQARVRTKNPHIAVIGAGAFGGWTALHLLRRGARVTLLDACGAGNSRASSGGETRVIRGTYGPTPIYVQMVARALQLWRENEKRWGMQLYRRTGVLWLAAADDTYEKASLPLLRKSGLEFDELTAAQCAQRFPQINFEGVKWAIVEKDAGYLYARQACQAVLDAFVAEGGEYRQAAVAPGPISGGEMRTISLAGQRPAAELMADQFLFACGPWLGRIFPDVTGKLIRATRQEIFFFGVPAGDARFTEPAMPVWIDNGARLMYGIPAADRRGFKIADDARGPEFDPTSGERLASPEKIKAARDYLAFRFPALADAPLLESRVCQYENSPDEHFLLDRHPAAQNVWLLGGGSGHGFKHGPALGEMAARCVLDLSAIEPFFSLARFSSAS